MLKNTEFLCIGAMVFEVEVLILIQINIET